MARKLSIENLALVLFFIMLCLCFYIQFDMQSRYYPSFAVGAIKLNEKPTDYFPLANPDKYVLGAINNDFLTFRSLDETQIDELINSHSTSNIEYNGSYYRVGILNVDSFPPAALQISTFVGIPISVMAMVAICLVKAARFFRH